MLYVAVHIVSESSDHYNLLICCEDKEDFIKQVSDVIEQPRYWSQYWVTTNNPDLDRYFLDAMGAVRDADYELYEKEWNAENE